MSAQREPQFRHSEEIHLCGTMRVYASQAGASEHIPEQWQQLLRRRLPQVEAAQFLYGASPCTDDRKIHYLAGIQQVDCAEGFTELILEAGEYAVFTVEDIADLRTTWVWVLTDWLRSSNRRERNAPEFERFTAPYNPERASGSIEIWIPLELQS